MDFNDFHHNYMSTGSTAAKAVVTNCPTQYSDGTAFDNSAYVNNTNQNNYDYNVYDASTVGAATNQWLWMTSKTFTTWRAIPQVSGTGATQDVNGSRS